jgi:hypothetical protein
MKRLRAGFVFSLFVWTLFSAPWLRSQQIDEKDLAEKSKPQETLPEQKNERRSANTFSTRCELTTCVTKVFYLSNLSQPTEIQDFVNLLRTIGEVGRIQQIPFEQLVIVRGTPEQITFAEKMADELDRDKRRFGGVGYRLDFKVSESTGDRKSRSRSYSLWTNGREIAKLGVGKPAPATSQNDASPDKKQTPDGVAGRNIECRVFAENERTIDLFVDGAFAGSRMRPPGKDEKAGAKGSADPTQLHIRDRVILELGKPTVIAKVDDPDTELTIQLEVTATRVIEGP